MFDRNELRVHGKSMHSILAFSQQLSYDHSMVGVAASIDSKFIVILGHGLTIEHDFELSNGIFLSPSIPKIDLDATVKGCRHFADYAAAIQGSEIATFVMRVGHDEGGEDLVVKTWNALWLFHLLSAACRAPCFSLYSISDGAQPLFSATNRSPFVRPLTKLHSATRVELEWARRHTTTFDKLIHVPAFSAAMRCYGNAHLLPDYDVRIMLLWAGIEGLLSVDAELSRRIALYAALLFEGTPDQKATYFDQVKRAYSIRSRAVHGGGLTETKLEEGYRTAGRILIDLLARCVALGRVPTPSELDRLAVASNVSEE